MQKKHMIISGVAIGLLVILMILKTITGGGAVNSMSGAINAGSELTTGSFELTISNTEEKDEELTAHPTFKIYGQSYNGSHMIGLSVTHDNEEIIGDQLLLITTENIYVHPARLNTFTTKFLDVESDKINDTKDIWVPITYGVAEENQEAYYNLFSILGDFIKIGSSNIEITTEDTFYTINATKKEDTAAIYNNLITYITENKEAVNTLLVNFLSPITVESKTELYKSLADTKETLSDAEFANRIIDKIKIKLETMAFNTSLSEEQFVSCSVSYNTAENGMSSFIENVALKYLDNDVMKHCTLSFTFEENTNSIDSIPAENIATKNEEQGINDLINKLIEFDYKKILNVDFTEDNTREFDVFVKDNFIVCTNTNETYTRKVMYTTKKDDFEEMVVFVMTDNAVADKSFEEYYTGKGYSKHEIPNTAALTQISEMINEQIASEITKSLKNDILNKSRSIYIATPEAIKEMNKSNQSIDDFVLKLKDE